MHEAAVGPAFWCLSAAIIVCALGVVLARNMVHSAVSLAGVLFFVAGIYLNLQADLLAGFQVLIYVGAVVTLILFAIMLIENLAARTTLQTNRRWGVGAVAALGALGLLCWVIGDSRFPTSEQVLRTDLEQTAAAGGVELVPSGRVRSQDLARIRNADLQARANSLSQRLEALAGRERTSTYDSRMREFSSALIDTYVLPFELASILLLVALAGAIVIAQQSEREEAGDGH